MDAMILAAGEGTRLRPLTSDTPKALVEVAGVPMLERVARRLVAAGADRLIVNVHYLADQVEAFLEEHDGFGAEVRISREPGRRLETGGGLLHAREHFREDGPFYLHNADVVSEVDLEAMLRLHRESDALATLGVRDRSGSRALLFDEDGLLGRRDRVGRQIRARAPAGPVRALGFTGIHVISPGIFDLLEEEGRFSIVEPYLRLVGEGRRIVPFDLGDALWMDIGTLERLDEARRALQGR